jgi:hypothetical protein
MLIARNITISLIQYPVQNFSCELIRKICSIRIASVEAFLWRNDQNVKKSGDAVDVECCIHTRIIPIATAYSTFHFSGLHLVCEIECSITERFGIATK